ncbi:MAG: threonine/serine exporter family protein [Enterococcus lemanii]
MDSNHLLTSTCLLAGKIMMESGSEVYRVEDTMNRIAKSAGREDSVSYVTVTGIFLSFRQTQHTQIENVGERSINLEKIVAVNQLSRDFAFHKIDLPQLYAGIRKIEQEVPAFSKPLQLLSAGVVSCTLMYSFGGTWEDFLATFLIGIIGYFLKDFAHDHLKVLFLDCFIAALGIGIAAVLAVHFGFAHSVDNLIIGSVMPLVPGVAITTSFRDILAGHLISGLVRGTEAIIVASAIGVGIATALILLGGIL